MEKQKVKKEAKTIRASRLKEESPIGIGATAVHLKVTAANVASGATKENSAETSTTWMVTRTRPNGHRISGRPMVGRGTKIQQE